MAVTERDGLALLRVLYRLNPVGAVLAARHLLQHSDTQAEILLCRLGMSDGCIHTYAELSRTCCLAPRRIRQHESSAVAWLDHSFAVDGLLFSIRQAKDDILRADMNWEDDNA